MKQRPDRQVVAVLGRGHTVPGAVPHQLRDMGIDGTAVLWPLDREADCKSLAGSGADAVFGLAEPKVAVVQRRRLGVTLTAVKDGVRIDGVEAGSIAAAAGLRNGDVVLEMAGAKVQTFADVRRTVERQAPGTWLPLRVRREDGEADIVARFPP